MRPRADAAGAEVPSVRQPGDDVLVFAGRDETEVARLGVAGRPAAQGVRGSHERRVDALQRVQLRAPLRREVQIGEERADRADRQVEEHHERDQQRCASDAVPAHPPRARARPDPVRRRQPSNRHSPRGAILLHDSGPHRGRGAATPRASTASAVAARSLRRSARLGVEPVPARASHECEQQVAQHFEARLAVGGRPEAFEQRRGGRQLGAFGPVAGAALHPSGEREGGKVLRHVREHAVGPAPFARALDLVPVAPHSLGP